MLSLRLTEKKGSMSSVGITRYITMDGLTLSG